MVIIPAEIASASDGDVEGSSRASLTLILRFLQFWQPVLGFPS